VVSVVAAGSLVSVAALTGSLTWSTLGAVTAAVMVCLALWLVLRSLVCRRGPSVVGSWIRRPVGLLTLLTAAALLSLSWLLPGPVSAHSNSGSTASVDGIEWLVRPDGSRLGLHAMRATAATKPPLVVLHGGPGVADMAHDAPAFAPLATDRDIYSLPWSTAGYRHAFSQSRLVMIPDAGHVAYLEQPELYLETVDAFLHDRALPLPTLDGATVPPHYRGTR